LVANLKANLVVYNLYIQWEASLSPHPSHQEVFSAIPDQQVDPVSLPTNLNLQADFLVILSHQEVFLATQTLHKPQEVFLAIPLHHLQEVSFLILNHLEAF